MADVQQALNKLDDTLAELDRLSRENAETAEQLEAVTRDYRTFIETYTVTLYDETTKDGARLPGDKDLRMMLARQAMPMSLREKFDKLTFRREWLLDRIRDLRAEADGYRSILSAAKTELEATA